MNRRRSRSNPTVQALADEIDACFENIKERVRASGVPYPDRLAIGIIGAVLASHLTDPTARDLLKAALASDHDAARATV